MQTHLNSTGNFVLQSNFWREQPPSLRKLTVIYITRSGPEEIVDSLSKHTWTQLESVSGTTWGETSKKKTNVTIMRNRIREKTCKHDILEVAYFILRLPVYIYSRQQNKCATSKSSSWKNHEMQNLRNEEPKLWRPPSVFAWHTVCTPVRWRGECRSCPFVKFCIWQILGMC